MLTGLSPGQTYYYIVGNDNDGWSPESSFTVMDPTATSIRIGVWGDIGQTANSSATFDALMGRNPQLIINCGDFSYAGELLAPSKSVPACPLPWVHGSILAV